MKEKSSVMFIFAWVIFFVLMFVFFVNYKGNKEGHYQVQKGVVTITPDSLGHYRLMGMINYKPVKFIVDTGASLIAIPESLADSLQLKKLTSVTMQTANGKMNGSLTRLDYLSFGSFELFNLKAVIIPSNEDNDVLLGMNVLSKFNLSQQDGKLIIKQ